MWFSCFSCYRYFRYCGYNFITSTTIEPIGPLVLKMKFVIFLYIIFNDNFVTSKPQLIFSNSPIDEGFCRICWINNGHFLSEMQVPELPFGWVQNSPPLKKFAYFYLELKIKYELLFFPIAPFTHIITIKNSNWLIKVNISLIYKLFSSRSWLKWFLNWCLFSKIFYG